jgi:hypothetical protein
VIVRQPLDIGSFEELLREEPQILTRIADVPNGGYLFIIHPFRLLADIGVRLAPTLEAELVRRFPELSGLSDVPYDALKASEAPQRIQFNIRGLFRRRQG